MEYEEEGEIQFFAVKNGNFGFAGLAKEKL